MATSSGPVVISLTTTQETTTVQVSAGDTVADIKLRIEDAGLCVADLQRLVYKGAILKDTETVGSLGLLTHKYAPTIHLAPIKKARPAQEGVASSSASAERAAPTPAAAPALVRNQRVSSRAVQQRRPPPLVDSAGACNVDASSDTCDVSSCSVKTVAITRMPGRCRITELLMSSNRDLGPAFPKEIMQLPSLRVLSLAGCRLSAVPPTLFSSMPHLTSLNLSQNALTKLPTTVNKCPTLQSLNLSHNSLAELPIELGLLPALTHLFLHSNRLTSVPKAIGKLGPTLRRLYIADNRLSRLPDTVANLALCSLGGGGLEGNDGLIDPPPDIAKQSFNVVRQWMRQPSSERERQIKFGASGLAALAGAEAVRGPATFSEQLQALPASDAMLHATVVPLVIFLLFYTLFMRHLGWVEPVEGLATALVSTTSAFMVIVDMHGLIAMSPGQRKLMRQV